VLGAFLSERCELGGWTETGDLTEAYREFVKAAGERPLSKSALTRRLKERRIQRRLLERGTYVYDGVRLKEAA
jgi:hypothetical protein